MTPEQFWNNSDYTLYWAYRQAYINRIEQEYKAKKFEIDNSAWLGGYYFRLAYVSARNEEVQYPLKPIDFTIDPNNLTEEQFEEEQAKVVAESIAQKERAMRVLAEQKKQQEQSKIDTDEER